MTHASIKAALLLCTAALAAGCGTAPPVVVPAAAAPATSAPSLPTYAGTEPLGAAMEGWAYPYRRGVLVEDMGQTWLAEPDSDSDEARTLRPLQAAAATYRIAFGPRAGQKVLTLRGAERGHGTVPADGPVPREGLAPASAGAACKADAAGGPGPAATLRRHRRVQPARCGASGS